MGRLLYRFHFCILSTSHDMRSATSEASIMRLALLLFVVVCRVRGTSATSSSRSAFGGNATDSDLVRTCFRLPGIVALLCFPRP